MSKCHCVYLLRHIDAPRQSSFGYDNDDFMTVRAEDDSPVI